MGMYKGLKFEGIINKKYREDIETTLSQGDWSKCKNPIFKNFNEIDKSFMVPFGAVCYMPDSWEYTEKSFNKDTGLLSFQCSLKKNCNDVIKYFIEKIIPVVCDQLIYCEDFLEQSEVSNVYKFENGSITKLDGIRYFEEGYSKQFEELADVDFF